MKVKHLLWIMLMPLSASAIEIHLRDSETGQALQGQVEWTDEQGQRHHNPIDGSGQLQTQGSAIRLEARAEGHKPLLLERTIPADSRMTLQLDPLPELSKERQPTAPPIGYMGLELRLLDADSALPVAQGKVMLAGVVSMTEEEPGLLRMHWPLNDHKRADEMIWLEVHAPGYRSQRLAFFPQAGWWKQVIYLTPGQGLDVIEPAERLSRYPWKSQDNLPAETGNPPSDKAMLATAIEPPSSITVGFADANCSRTCCSSSQCSHSCTFSLETYVRRGLNDEWIPSWNQHALRAGSIAYRSYGAWHVNNPRTRRYDICSNACCQVNDPDTSTGANQAATATVGMMLTYGSTPARSEYSAENNSWNDPNDGLSCSNADLSCGDGFVGSPSTGWPCLADSVAQGRGCFGHGRGMSQWGSQRWTYNSNGNRLFNWIVNHYYNNNGNPSGKRSVRISSPIALHGLQVLPAQAPEGSSVQLQLDVSNLAAGDHNRLLIGASLYQTGTGYVDDPGNDQPFTLPAGTRANRNRSFDLAAANVAPGTWDVIVAVWLDVDEDGQISSNDEPLQTLRLNQALQVTATVASDALFADSFEN